jgi:hypothetical protein
MIARSNFRRSLLAPMWVAILLGMAISPPVAAAPATVRLSDNGKAQLPVVVGAAASDGVRATAQTLAEYLGRISGGAFIVQQGDGSGGIAVGLPTDFDKSPLKPQFATGPFERETYVLTSRDNGIWLLGATELAVQHAAWDLLYRIGHRQFFATPTWEVVPEVKTIALAVDATERPDIYARRIWYGWGMMDWNQQPYAQWNARNRMAQGFGLNSGHAYGSIILSNKDEFDKHPEYYALINGERKPDNESKMCLSNAGLRQLVVDHMIRAIERNPQLDSVSVDPSDGGDWCEKALIVDGSGNGNLRTVCDYVHLNPAWAKLLRPESRHPLCAAQTKTAHSTSDASIPRSRFARLGLLSGAE